MTWRLVRFLLLAPLLLSGCDVVLTLFAVPVQASPGSVVTITIAGNIAGNTGYAGCVMQVPIGWTLLGVTTNQNWPTTLNDPSLLAAYTAEPGHYLASIDGTGTGGIGGPRTLSQMTLTASVAQFAAITAAPYARPIFVGVPPAVDYVADSNGLPPEQVNTAWSGVAFGDVDGDGRDDLAAVHSLGGTGTRCFLSGPGTTWVESSTGLPTNTVGAYVAF